MPLRNYDNTGPEMPDNFNPYDDKKYKKPKISTKDAFTAPEGTVKAPGAAASTSLSKEGVKNWLKNKGGAASDVFAKLAQNTPGSVHRGVDYNQNIASAAGETSDPNVVVQDGYSGGIKTGEGPQTTLLRNTETEGKKKKKNKYSHYDIG